MGFSLGRLLKKGVRSIVKRAPVAVGGFLTGGPAGAALALSTSLAGKFVSGGVGAGVPSIQELTGAAPFIRPVGFTPQVQTEGVPMPAAAGAVAVGISRAVVSAVLRLAGAMGVLVTAANFRRVAMRLWRAVTGLARRHPGISILAFLTGLGLAADEAAEFLFWGQQMQRRRRGRGISARDIRICRRTMRRMAAFQSDLLAVRRPGAPRRARRGDGVVVARAG